MKNFSFNQLSILFSFLLALVVVGVCYFLFSNFFLIRVLIFFGLTFVVSYLLLYLMVKPWFKSIVTSAGKKLNENRIQKSDMSTIDLPIHQQLNYEVDKWINERKNEVEQLKKLENYRKEFLGNVSHELKTPVFNIQGYILTLLDGGLEDKSINRDYLQRAEKSIDRMISMIDDLEAITQLETGELQLEIERFELISLIKDVFESHELKSRSKGILFSLKDDLTAVFVMADKFRIRQVLSNLIVNSVKYGKENGETQIHLYEKGEQIVVKVKDNGIGISPEHLPRLFERFYRVDKSRSRVQGGTGLGLAIVKHIIEAHGQTIKVESTPGVGTTFTFTLNKW